MTREPFIAHSELTNEIYIVTNKEKYRVTEQVIKAVRATKALEQEQKTGHWKKIGYDIYECSICGQNVMTGDICAYKHCHGCGAKMESEEKQ